MTVTRDAAGPVVQFRLVDVFDRWRPGSYDPPWSWADERQDLAGEIRDLVSSIREHGVREPVLLGGDGRVWDGHHRLVAAELAGAGEVPVQFAGDITTASPPPAS